MSDMKPPPYISEDLAEVLSRHQPIHKVQELGRHKHPHANTNFGQLDVDMESCQVDLWCRVGEDGTLQDFAFAQLPCGQWVYWSERGRS